MAQWLEHSPPTSVARARRHMWVAFFCRFSPLLLRDVFSTGTPVFSLPQKSTFPNSNSARNQVDEEPLNECPTS